jgi:hypothetical protein
MFRSLSLRRALILGVPAATIVSVLALMSTANATHVRPKAATPLYSSFVLAYPECTGTTYVHGSTTGGAAGFPSASCGPPSKSSTFLTVGTPDANGLPSGLVGTSKLTTIAGPDIRMAVNITDVHCDVAAASCVGGGGFPAAYTGTVGMHYRLRITDHCNGPIGPAPPCPAPPGTSATARDQSFLTPVPCAATGPAPAGSTCSLTTTFNTVLPGAITAGMRMQLSTHEVDVTDGGADGSAATLDAAQKPFLYEGVFVP